MAGDDPQVKDRIDALERRLVDREQTGADPGEAEGVRRQVPDRKRGVFWIRDQTSRRFVYVSPSYELVSGRRRQDMLDDPQDFFLAVHPEDRPGVVAGVRIQDEGGPFFNQEFRLQRPDGTIRWVWVRTFPLPDESGRVDRLLGLGEDITPQKVVEAKLRQSESFLDSVIDQSPTPMWISDAQGTLIRINRACRELLGVTAQEVIGKYNILEDNIVVEQGLLPLVKSVFEDGRKINFKIKYDSSQLQTIALEQTASVVLDTTISPVRNTQGEIVNAVIQHQDITERELAKQQLEESEANYRSIFEAANDAILVLEMETGAILDVNQRVVEMFGYTPEEVRRLDVETLSSGEPPYTREEALRRIERAAAGSPQLFELRAKDKRGRSFWVEVNLRRAAIGGEERLLAVVRDISERKIAEEALQQSELKFRLVTESIQDVFWMSTWGVDEMVYISPAYETIWERSRESLYQNPRSFLEAVHPDDLDEYLGVVDEYHRHGRAYECEYRVTRGDGEVRWIHERGYPVPLSPGGERLMTGVCVDVTDGKRVEDAVSKSEAMTRALLSGIPDLVLRLRRDGTYLDYHAPADVDLIMDPEEFLGKKVSEVLPAEVAEQRMEVIARAFDTGEIQSFQYQLVRRDEVVHYDARIMVSGEDEVVMVSRDITEQRRNEEALHEREEYLRSLFNSTSDAILTLDADRKIVRTNQAFNSLFGYTPEEIIGRSAALLHPSEESFREAGRLVYPEVGRVGSWRGEWELSRKDGSRLPVETVTSIITRPDGLPSGYVSVIRDITERKQAEKALRESEEKFRNLFNNAEVGMFRTKLDGSEMVDMNDKFLEIFGLTREEMLGTPSVMHWADPLEREEMVRRLEAEGRVVNFECGMLNKSGETRRCLTSLVVYPEQGILEGSISDITDRKRAEAALQEQEKLLNEVGRIAKIGGWEMDLITRRAKWTEATYQIVEIEPGQPVPGPDEHLDYYLPEYRPLVQEAMRALVEDDRPLEFEAQLRTAKGNVKWCRAQGRVIRKNGQAVRLVGTFQDITERKRMEDALRQSQKMEAVGTLAGGVAHDFNNLMTAVTGFGQFALEALEPNHPAFQDIQEVIKAGERATSLTRQLLAFSRKQILEPKVVDLNAIVANMEKMLSRLIGEDIAMRTIFDPDLGRVRVDPGQVEQIVMNLAVNAREAMPTGGKLTIETGNVNLDEAYASQHPDMDVTPGPHVMLAVSDSGPGMDEAVRAKIFEPFFTTKGRAESTGLGLSTVYGIVKQSGGDIHVYSELGRGTTFKIYFRRVDETAGTREPVRPAAAPAPGAEVILVVEDEPTVRTLISRSLATHGYQVLAAAHGREAIQLNDQHPGEIHLLLTDVVMPLMSGRELAGRLAESRPDMKVLYMSGYTDNVVAHHGVLDRGMAFISKPFSTEDLIQKIRQVLET